mgnify:FL=1
MISATEARELYDASGKEVENWIESKVKPLVVDAATAGNRYVCIYIDSIEKYREVPESDNLIDNVISKLISLGYHVKLAKYGGPYVPISLKYANGDGPLYINYGLDIGW